MVAPEAGEEAVVAGAGEGVEVTAAAARHRLRRGGRAPTPQRTNKKLVAMIHGCNEVFLAFQNNVHRLDIDSFKKKENEKRKMLATEAISFKRRKLCAYEYDVTIE